MVHHCPQSVGRCLALRDPLLFEEAGLFGASNKVRCLVLVGNHNSLVLCRALSFVELPAVFLQGLVWGVGPRGHEKGANLLLLCVEDDRVSPQFRDHCVGSLVGVPNVVHTFGNNVLFVKVCDNCGNGVLVDRDLDFVLAPSNFVLRMECLLVVGESGQGDRWVSERRFDGAAAIQGVIVCDLAYTTLFDLYFSLT